MRTSVRRRTAAKTNDPVTAFQSLRELRESTRDRDSRRDMEVFLLVFLQQAVYLCHQSEELFGIRFFRGKFAQLTQLFWQLQHSAPPTLVETYLHCKTFTSALRTSAYEYVLQEDCRKHR